MNRIRDAMQDVNIIGKLADLKDQHYRNTLLLSAIVELLVEKNLISTDELSDKIKQLDQLAMPGNPIKLTRREADHPIQ
jgi:hypothetical protein